MARSEPSPREIHTRSFEVQSITTLDVGYVAFGDDYKRGELLVNLNREHEAVGVDCGSELPDHLPNVLRLMARWQDPELVMSSFRRSWFPRSERCCASSARIAWNRGTPSTRSTTRL